MIKQLSSLDKIWAELIKLIAGEEVKKGRKKFSPNYKDFILFFFKFWNIMQINIKKVEVNTRKSEANFEELKIAPAK